MLTAVDPDTRGIVHPGVGLRHFRLTTFAPSPAVARVVERYWVSAELGYSDQAHLIRDFRSMFGVTPRQYASGAI